MFCFLCRICLAGIHNDIIRGYGIVFILHVSPPVVLSRKTFPSRFRVWAALYCAMIFALGEVFIVDVTIEVCLGSKPHITTEFWTLMWPLMISLVMTGASCCQYTVAIDEPRRMLATTDLNLWN